MKFLCTNTFTISASRRTQNRKWVHLDVHGSRGFILSVQQPQTMPVRDCDDVYGLVHRYADLVSSLGKEGRTQQHRIRQEVADSLAPRRASGVALCSAWLRDVY
jgi:hypothetical protein